MINAEEWAADWGRRLGGVITDVERMVGGASRETWALRLDGRPLVLRRDPPGALRAGAMSREAALIRAAGAAGVPVPEVVASGDDFIVMERLYGETIPRRILRDEAFAGARAKLTVQCAEALARLHRTVQAIDGMPADDNPLASLRDVLDAFGEPHPALELGFLRLAKTRPAATARTVVHGDFRLGNLMVDGGGLVGVLDWELAHVGDPAEDLGWLCVPSWRFGGPAPVAGVGTREELLAAYAAAGGAPVDLETLSWWEAFGTLRWGVITVQQAVAHWSGAVRSVELAAIGRRTCEVELDLLDLLAPTTSAATDATTAPHQQRRSSGPHDRPTAGELLEAVREWLDGVALTGHDAFLQRVASRALQIVERELALGPDLAVRHTARLQQLGVETDTELAAQIRAGRDSDDVVAAVRAAVIDKLRVADPRHLQR